MEKSQKYCSNCQTKYTVEWDEDKSDLEPLTCPFCGYEVEDEQDETGEVWSNDDSNEDDNWN